MNFLIGFFLTKDFCMASLNVNGLNEKINKTL